MRQLSRLTTSDFAPKKEDKMRRGSHRPGLALLGLTVTLVTALAAPLAQAATVSIDPSATYLRTNRDPNARDTLPIVLAALGISAGDLIQLEQLGDFSAWIGSPDTFSSTVGIFSGSSVLLASNLQKRVRDAIDAGADVRTLPTYNGNLPTDVAEDFSIPHGGVFLQVPPGATHLFVSVNDAFYGDNTDPDRDYAVRITLAEKLVTIAINPGSSPNSLNPQSGGNVSVAILSTPLFNAPARVDPASLTFGRTGSEKSLADTMPGVADVNGDGLPDLVVHFQTQVTGFRSGDTQGVLKGQTVDGLPFRGIVAVQIVP